MEESKKKIISQVIITILTFLVAFFGTRYLMSNFNSADKELKKIAIEINKSAPTMVDKDTRLDNVSVFENTLQYNYTLINIAIDDAGLDLDGAKKFIMKNAQDNLDNRPEMKDYREKKIALKYNYKDKNSKQLFDFTVKTNKK
jgi:hypothetical protein